MTNEKGEANVRHYDADPIGRKLMADCQAIEMRREIHRLIEQNNPGLCGVLQRVLKMLRDAQ